MRNLAWPLILFAVASCASVEEQEGAVARNNAIEDYIQVSELNQIQEIRKRGELRHQEVNAKHIILTDSRNAYLAVFRQRCREIGDHDIKPDIRHDPRVIRARFDTYRGCRIDTLYELNEGQVKELLDLGEKSNN